MWIGKRCAGYLQPEKLVLCVDRHRAGCSEAVKLNPVCITQRVYGNLYGFQVQRIADPVECRHGRVKDLIGIVSCGIQLAQSEWITGGMPGCTLGQGQLEVLKALTAYRPAETHNGGFANLRGGRKIYKVEGDLATQQLITVGTTSITEVEILSGLEEGDTIVISDTSRFQDAKSILLRK